MTRSKKPTSRNAWRGELGDLERAVQHPERWRHLVPVQGKEDQRSEWSRPHLETLAVMRDMTTRKDGGVVRMGVWLGEEPAAEQLG